MREIEIQKEMDHENILQLVHHNTNLDMHTILLEYCKIGSMSSLVYSDKDIEPYLLELLLGAITALIHVALRGYAHLDVKLENILVGLIRKNGEMKLVA